LLSRYNGQADVTIGTPVAARNRLEIEDLNGFFVNTLVMRVDLSNNPRFWELLRRVRETALGAYAHQDLPFEKLVERLQPERDLGHTPLFQVMLVLQNVPHEKLELSGLSLRPFEVEGGTARFDLTLLLEEGEQGLNGAFEYSTDLFTSTTIERLAAQFKTMLAGIASDPEQRVRDLPLLTTADRTQLLVEWNNTHAPYPENVCFHELFEAQTRRTPDALAISAAAEQLTYAELNQRANRLAHYMRGLGVGPESRVGILLERGMGMVTALLGVLKAGGAYLPLDPQYPAARLAYMLADAEVGVLITQEPLLSRVIVPPAARIVYLDAAQPAIEAASAENPASGVTADNLAYVIYTSGSTGQSKGVMIAHRGLSNLSEAQMHTFDLTPDMRVLQFASPSFDASIFEIVMALRAGATLYLASSDDLLPGPSLAHLLRAHAITNLTIPPSALSPLPVENYPALQTIVVAGEACSSELMTRWAKGRRFFNA